MSAKLKQTFSYEYDEEAHPFGKTFEVDEDYPSNPQPLVVEGDRFSYRQPWSGYVAECKLPPEQAALLPCQTANIKPALRYQGAEVIGNKWMRLACAEALRNVQAGGGPFGTIIVQIDDETGRAIRYWIGHNMVTEWHDPTAHGEVDAIRIACKALGVFDLGTIKKDDPHLKLPQKGKTSHCDLYTSAEPCAMCYSATRWARISNIYFAATIYDAAQQGLDFADEMIYAELSLNYADRARLGANCFQCTVDNSLDAFNYFKRQNCIKY